MNTPLNVIDRRAILRAALAMPAIVMVGNIMPISAKKLPIICYTNQIVWSILSPDGTLGTKWKELTLDEFRQAVRDHGWPWRVKRMVELDAFSAEW